MLCKESTLGGTRVEEKNLRSFLWLYRWCMMKLETRGEAESQALRYIWETSTCYWWEEVRQVRGCPVSLLGFWFWHWDKQWWHLLRQRELRQNHAFFFFFLFQVWSPTGSKLPIFTYWDDHLFSIGILWMHQQIFWPNQTTLNSCQDSLYVLGPR